MKTNCANFLKNKHFLLPNTHTFEIHPFAFLPTGTLHLNGKKIVYYEHLFTTYNELLLILMLEKTQLVLFDQSNNTGAVDVKMEGSVLGENSSFKMLVLTFFFKLD